MKLLAKWSEAALQCQMHGLSQSQRFDVIITKRGWHIAGLSARWFITRLFAFLGDICATPQGQGLSVCQSQSCEGCQAQTR